MGQVCGFSLEFVIKGKSSNRVEMDDKVFGVFLCCHHMGVWAQSQYKTTI